MITLHIAAVTQALDISGLNPNKEPLRVVAGAREADPPEERPFRVRLMGSQERHNHAEASVRLLAPSGLVDALTQPSVVTSFAQ